MAGYDEVILVCDAKRQMQVFLELVQLLSFCR